ncbi:MAG: hypothetical protein JW727_04415 [Candidatus Aenigmarchaeota archaeon]|nr:hypothetical protein [Candidatus Aenigmarchaeota archaeon]
MNARRFKGQVSLEYLMTYGIAIAIVVIAVAALYSMGVFSSGSSTTTPPCTPCFSDFAYNAHSYNGSHLALEVKNRGEGINLTACLPSGCVLPSPATVNANQVFILYVPNNGANDVGASLTYTKAGSSLSQTRTQTLQSGYFQ